MDASLFRMYIRDVILPLYPNISKHCIMENGTVIQDPVCWKLIVVQVDSKKTWNIFFLEHTHSIGLNIILSLPNWTHVHAELDQFFVTYKGYCRTRTLSYFAWKIKYKINLIEEKQKTRNEFIRVTNLKNMEKDLEIVIDYLEREDQHKDATIQS